MFSILWKNTAIFGLTQKENALIKAGQKKIKKEKLEKCLERRITDSVTLCTVCIGKTECFVQR